MSFFFFKQKTAYEMRISDWSSDVCSSDLDGRTDEYHQIGLGAALAARLEQFAHHRNVGQQRNPLDRLAFIIVQQPAQRQYLAIVDRHGRLDLALVDDEVARIIRYRPSDTANLLPQEQLDRTARIDLRIHLQLTSEEHTSELQS